MHVNTGYTVSNNPRQPHAATEGLHDSRMAGAGMRFHRS